MQNENTDFNEEFESIEDVEQHAEHTKGYIDDPDEYVQKTGKPIETFRSEEEYNEFGQLKNEIKALRDDVHKWRNTAQAMGNMYTDVERKAYERAFTEVQGKMFEASQNGDFQTYNHHQQELNSLTWQDQQRRMQVQQEQGQQLLAEFTKRNGDWYNETNPKLKKRADVIFNRIRLANPNIPIPHVLQQVEDEIRVDLDIPHAQGSSPPAIPRGVSNTNRSAHSGKSKLAPEYRREFDEFKQNMAIMGVTDYTEDDFVSYKRKYGEM